MRRGPIGWGWDGDALECARVGWRVGWGLVTNEWAHSTTQTHPHIRKRTTPTILTNGRLGPHEGRTRVSPSVEL